jgi:hypothetical protein
VLWFLVVMSLCVEGEDAIWNADKQEKRLHTDNSFAPEQHNRFYYRGIAQIVQLPSGVRSDVI